MKKITLFSVLAVLCLKIMAQSPPIKPLKIGDTVPEVILENLVNYESSSINLSVFREKLLILDFMHTACIACIEALPEMNKISREFYPDVQIMLVTPEDSSRIIRFQTNNMYGKQNSIPFVGKDTILSALFPHQYIPHIVWINRGKVAAITYPEYVTRENIKNISGEQVPNWPVKREITSFNPALPLFTINEGNIPEVSQPRQTYYTILTTHLSGVPKTFARKEDSLAKFSTIRFLGYSIIDLYLLALHKPVSFPIGRIMLRVRDTSRFVFDSNKAFSHQWKVDNTYAYEAVLPLTGAQLESKLKSDLDAYFNLSVSLKQENIPCYVLGKHLSPVSSIVNKQATNKRNQITIGALVNRLSHTQYGQFAVNESGLADSIKIDLSPECYSDMTKMKERLSAYGLTLTMQTRNTEVLWVEEK